MQETWRDVVGYEGLYEVSDWGRVKSVARRVNHRSGSRRVQERILMPGTCNRYGHLIVNLSRHCKPKTYLVHQLVLRAFVGPPPEGMATRHLNDDKTNNRLTNLVWGTQAENIQDSLKNGGMHTGERHYAAKHTNKEVHKIKMMWDTGMYSITGLARLLGERRQFISAIVHKTKWKHA